MSQFTSGDQNISFSFNISPSNEYSGLISLRIGWLDLLAVQGTLESSEASILQPSVFFIVQLSHPYMTTGKTIALTRWTFVVQSLCRIRLFVIPWTATHKASLSFTISQRLLRLMSIELVMASSHLILYHPLLLLPSVFPSIRVFSN